VSLSTKSRVDPASSAKTLTGRIDGLRLEVRNHLLLTILAQAALAIVILGLASLFLDFMFRLSYPTRVVQWLAGLALLAWYGAHWVHGRWLHPLLADDLALTVERRFPELDCRLVSAVQFIGRPVEGLDPFARHVAEAVIVDAEERSRELELGAVLDKETLNDRLLQAGVALFVALIIGSQFTIDSPDREERFYGAAIWAQRNLLLQGIDWPRQTDLSVSVAGMSEGRVTLPAGAKLNILVEAKGVIPRKVFIKWEPIDGDVDLEKRELASGQAVFVKVGDYSFRHSFASVTDGFKFEVWGGDDREGPLLVEVVRKPWIRKLEVASHAPKHTGRPELGFQPGVGDLAIPTGTKVELRGICSKRLKRAWLTAFAPAEPKVAIPPLPMTIASQGEGFGFGVALVVSQTLVVSLNVEDRDRLSIENPPRMTFRAVVDRAPRVSIRAKGVGNMVTPEAALPLTIKGRDDYGLTKGQLSFSYTAANDKSKGGKGELPVAELAKGRSAEAGIVWDIASIKLKPGSFLTLWAEAWDNDGIAQPKRGRSQAMTLRIVNREELMNDMIRRQQEQRRAFEEALRVERGVLEALEKGIPAAKTARSHARTQQRIARRSSSIRKALALILDEMRNNKILEAKDLVRLRRHILEPLSQLNDQDLPISRRSLQELAGEEDGSKVYERALEEVESIVDLMERIKNQMLRLETLTELISRLEGIIRLHEEVLDGLEHPEKLKKKVPEETKKDEQPEDEEKTPRKPGE